MNAAPRTAAQVWLKKSWKLVNNPFPTTGIARLGGADQRENGLLYEPEVNADKVKHVQGMNIAIVTTARNDEEGRTLLREFGMPFRKDLKA